MRLKACFHVYRDIVLLVGTFGSATEHSVRKVHEVAAYNYKSLP